uniref:Uncharacterized protein n=1 Tax=Cucumis melo TaxID=3656 RepID=A0A9I9DJ77_CUCME
MEHKRIEEKLEEFDQEIAEIQLEFHKLPTIEEKLLSMMKSIERLEIQGNKQQQLLLKYVEGIMKKRSTLLRGMEESLSKEQSIERIVKGGGAMMKGIKIDEKTTTVEEYKNSNDLIKIKVGIDSYLCLFGAGQYLQVHKLTDFEK